MTQLEGCRVATVNYTEVNSVHRNFHCGFSPCSRVSSLYEVKGVANSHSLKTQYCVSDQTGHLKGFLRERHNLAYRHPRGMDSEMLNAEF